MLSAQAHLPCHRDPKADDFHDRSTLDFRVLYIGQLLDGRYFYSRQESIGASCQGVPLVEQVFVADSMTSLTHCMPRSVYEQLVNEEDDWIETQLCDGGAVCTSCEIVLHGRGTQAAPQQLDERLSDIAVKPLVPGSWQRRCVIVRIDGNVAHVSSQ